MLRFNATSKLETGSAADGVFGQPNFTTNAMGILPTNRYFLDPTSARVDSYGMLWVADFMNADVAAKPNGAVVAMVAWILARRNINQAHSINYTPDSTNDDL